MVDPELIDVSRLDLEIKRRIVLYVIDERKISSGVLGYSASYMYKIKKRRIYRLSMHARFKLNVDVVGL